VAGLSVSDIRINAPDETGVPIEEVYAKIDGMYAVYRTADRVLIQFSEKPSAKPEDEPLGSQQRKCLVPLTALRGELRGLIDSLYPVSKLDILRGTDGRRRFERRVADALVVALQGLDHIPYALDLLKQVRQDLLDERTAWARFKHVLVAGITVAVVLLLVCVSGYLLQENSTACTLGDGCKKLPTFVDKYLLIVLLYAAGSGAVGAFFSIAVAIRRRTIQTDLIDRSNCSDAALRVVIGVIGAVVLLGFLCLNIVTIAGLTLDYPKDISKIPIAVLIAGFIAGFLERLVPDLMENSLKVTAQMPATPAVSPPLPKASGNTNESQPLSVPPST
jgi:hypothetical protein